MNADLPTPMPPLPPVRVRVPAKINVALVVGPRREDGFHSLATVFQAVNLYDEVVARWGEPGQFTLEMSGEGAEELPVDDRNLAIRAARLVAERFGGDAREKLGVHLVIRKGIPIAGGMAGGSADAAGALLACSVLWDLDTSPEELHDLAAELGSDVPFSLLGGVALGRNRGDDLVPILSRGRSHWVIVLSDEGLSTPTVFQRFDAMGGGATSLEPPEGMLAALAAGDPLTLAPLLRNDLQAPALDLRPDLKATLAAGMAAGALAGLVSGSGPTVAFLCRGEDHAIAVSAHLQGAGVGRAVRRVSGPVPGAQLVS